MVQDVLDNHLRLGMHYHEVNSLLGDVDCWTNTDDNENIILAYGIDVDWGQDIDPLNKYWLEITFSPDSLLTGAEYKDLQSGKPLSRLSN